MFRIRFVGITIRVGLVFKKLSKLNKTYFVCDFLKLKLADFLAMKTSWIQLIFHQSKQAEFSWFSSCKKSWIQLIIYQTNGWISNILATKIFWIFFKTKVSILFWVARNCYPISVRKNGNTNNGCDGPLCQGWDFKFCWWERARRRTIDPFLFKGK